jgi:hypothetical protein
VLVVKNRVATFRVYDMIVDVTFPAAPIVTSNMVLPLAVPLVIQLLCHPM